MELDWSTFFLEIVNFLILLWILKRFLYRPVLNVITRRREEVAKTLKEAKDLRAEADAMKAQYESRLSDWEQEKARARENLQRELETERSRQREQLQTLLAQERQKNQVVEERRLEKLARHKEKAALILAGRFIRRLLEKLACPELEARIIRFTLEELKQLPAERLTALRNHAKDDKTPARISTAYPLPETLGTELRREIDALLGKSADYQFLQDPALLAGLRIQIEPWVVQANLRDEWALFTEAGGAD